MDCFFYNTGGEDGMIDQPRPRYGMMIDQRFAVVSGSRQEYGELLRKLSPEDILLMYENGVGIVAVGRVLEHWNEVSHSDPVYYTPRELAGFDHKYEYRIAVDWFIDLSQSPISVKEAKERIGFISPQPLQRIVKGRAKAEALIDEIRTRHRR